MNLLREYIKETIDSGYPKMYHSTAVENVRDILANGLKTGTGTSAYTGTHAQWIDELYPKRPIFLSAEKGKYAGIPLVINISALDLVADLAEVADLGNSPPYVEDGMLIWDDGIGPEELASISHDGAVKITSMLIPRSKEANVAIAATGTAAVLQNIPASRVKIATWKD
tara:strand:+ start:610 stop:1116 length:507 start_codon:yes stop_codon:yes gene_type:complete